LKDPSFDKDANTRIQVSVDAHKKENVNMFNKIIYLIFFKH
jgi:hypothetical protein